MYYHKSDICKTSSYGSFAIFIKWFFISHLMQNCRKLSYDSFALIILMETYEILNAKL